MIIAVLGILDIIAGGILLLGDVLSLAGSSIVFWFMIIFFLKAAYSLITAFGAGFYFDLMGYLDLLGAIFMLLLFWGITFGFVFWIGILLVIVGLYSFVIGFISH